MAITKASYEAFFVYGSILRVQQDGTEIVDLANSSVVAEDKNGRDVSAIVLDQATKALHTDPKGSYSNNALKIRFRDGYRHLSPYLVKFRMQTNLSNRWLAISKVIVREVGTPYLTTTTTTTTTTT